MKLQQASKGITPVIAIVLLLIVTVGAVGVAYSQFQGIVGDGPEEFETTARQTEITITSVAENDDGQMNLTITNSQDSVTINSTEMLELQFYADGTDSGSSVPYQSETTINNINFGNENETATCFQPGHETTNTSKPGVANDDVVLDPGESFTCDTNVEWPSATNYVGLNVMVQGGDKSWSKECAPVSSNSETC